MFFVMWIQALSGRNVSIISPTCQQVLCDRGLHAKVHSKIRHHRLYVNLNLEN